MDLFHKWHLIKEFLKNLKQTKLYEFDFYEGNDLLDLEIEKRISSLKEYFEIDRNWPDYNYFDNIKESEKLILNHIDSIKNKKDGYQYSFKRYQIW